MKKYYLLIFPFVFVMLSGCGTLTGIPSHGGGKRFAIEQELVSATVRASIKDLDVSDLKGRRVTIFINAIGDAGSGNIAGGRYSLQALLRGETFNGVPTVETATYPLVNTTSSTSSNTSSNTTGNTDSATSSSTTSTTTGQQIVPGPTNRSTNKSGSGGTYQYGMEYKGIGSYLNSDRISSKDTLFLSAAFQTYLFLKGVNIVPPSEAEIDIYLTVDIFGTIRSRIDWLAANNEVLKAKTSLEMMAIDRITGEIISAPQVSSFEAEYNEQYVLWAGPVKVQKILRRSDGLLTDYTDLLENKKSSKKKKEDIEVVKNISLMYPFQSSIKKYKDKKRQKTKRSASH